MVLLCVAALALLSILGLRIVESDLGEATADRLGLHDVARRADAFNELLVYRDAVIFHRSDLEGLRRRVNTALADVEAHAIRRRNDSAASIGWARVRSDWTRIRRQPNRQSIDRLIDAAHEALLSADDETELSNDRSRSVRVLTGVAYIDAPQLALEIHELSDNLLVVLSQRPLNFAERVRGAALLTLMQTIKQGMDDDLSVAGRSDGQLSDSANHSMRRLDSAVDPFTQRVGRMLFKNVVGDRRSDSNGIRNSEREALNGIDDVVKRSNDEILVILDRVEQRANLNLLLTRLGLVVLWFLVLYGVVRYAENLREQAKQIQEYEAAEKARKDEEERRVNAEIALGVQTQMFRAVFERAPVGIATIDARGDIDRWNPELQRFLGGRKVNLIGDHQEELTELFARHAHLLHFERKFENVNKEELWASVTVSRIYDDGSNIALCTVQDITQKRHAESRLRHEATHDGLTGLANRKKFRAHLGEMLERQKVTRSPFAVLFIDLDLFKYVNDTFGHAAGDYVLNSVAERLRKISREHDLPARFGGDEFALLLATPCELELAERIALEITQSIAEPIFWEGQQVNIGSSIGLIPGPGPYDHAEEMMRNADTAMYAAKTTGRGRYVVFDPAMQDAAHQRAQLSNDLLSALSDPDQIHVLYQPIVSVADNAIMGFEALARWHHPQFGDIGPDDFVKIAEQSGAIRQLGRSVMRKAFLQLTAAGDRLPDLTRLWLSVNISPAELSAPDFVESVASTIRETDFDPSRLYLEITESRVIDSGEQANRILARLREFGIRVSIDDFGAGYSSLRYLNELDLDLIKIDPGFLKRSDGTDSRRAVLRAIVALAAAFDMPVCAEGVETNEHLRLVRTLGIQYAQGRIWGPPMSIAQIEGRFSGNSSLAERDRG